MRTVAKSFVCYPKELGNEIIIALFQFFAFCVVEVEFENLHGRVRLDMDFDAVCALPLAQDAVEPPLLDVGLNDRDAS